MVNKFIKVALLLLLSFMTVGTAVAQKKMTQVAANDCGVTGQQPFLVSGEDYTMPEHIKGSKAAQTLSLIHI